MEKRIANYILEDILQFYKDIEEQIIMQRAGMDEWDDPTGEKAVKLIELQQKLHLL